jgi:molybdopterin converting factor small subunit
VEYFPGQEERFDFPADKPLTIRQMLDILGVNPLLIMMANVNGVKRSKDYTITAGDEVLLFSPPSGG